MILGLVLQEKKLVVVLVLRIRFDYGMVLTNPDQKLTIKCKLTLTILVTLFSKSGIWLQFRFMVQFQKSDQKKNPDQKSDLVLVQFLLIGTNDSYLPKGVPSQHWFLLWHHVW
jgi:hypothetical protein